MLRRKKFIFFTITLFSMSYLIGQRCGSEIKDLYGHLLQLQGDSNPMYNNQVINWEHSTINKNSYTQMSKDMYNMFLPLFTTLFSNASKTGLMAQYKQLILSPNNEKIAGFFLDKEHLQVIAYMQNFYGGGNPFKYENKGQLQAGGLPHSLVSMGTYINPQNQTLIMTRYGILNGIIDAMVALDNEGQANNPYYQKFCNSFKINLVDAIKVAARQTLLQVAEFFEPSPQLNTYLISNLKSISGFIIQLKKIKK